MSAWHRGSAALANSYYDYTPLADIRSSTMLSVLQTWANFSLKAYDILVSISQPSLAQFDSNPFSRFHSLQTKRGLHPALDPPWIFIHIAASPQASTNGDTEALRTHSRIKSCWDLSPIQAASHLRGRTMELFLFAFLERETEAQGDRGTLPRLLNTWVEAEQVSFFPERQYSL